MRHARHAIFFATAGDPAVSGGFGGPSGLALHALFDRRATPAAVPCGASMVVEGDPADRLIRVKSGMLRCCVYSEDGRRQILRFAGPRDILGIYAIVARGWPYSVEASVDTMVEVLPCAVLEAALATDPTLLEAIHGEALAEMEQRGRALAILAEPRAETRLLRFLSDLAGIDAATGGASQDIVTLAMSRRDIADHLGLSHETVSRAFTALRRQHLIEMHGATHVSLNGVHRTRQPAD